MEEVVVSEATPSTSFSDVNRIICRVCQRQFAQYTCPRCNTRYCSLQCYKGHSVRCTESFMRENVMEEMQQVQVNDEDKWKMLDILRRFHSEEEENYDTENEPMISEETIQKALSGEEVRLEDLSLDEIKQFHRAVASGELSKMIEPWTPWWAKFSARDISLSAKGTQLVRPIQMQETNAACPSSDLDQEDNLKEIPAGPESPLPPLNQLSRSVPSPLLAVHLVDILYSYCFTLRLYNGEWQSDPTGAASVVLSMSKVLVDDGRPESVAEALSACLEQTCHPIFKHVGGFTFGLSLIDDILRVLYLGSDALICLLCDLQRLLRAGEKMLKAEKTQKSKEDKSRQELKSADKKVYFLMCWVHEQPREAWSLLAGLVEVEKASLLTSNKGSKPERAGDGNSQAKVLIEEV